MLGLDESAVAAGSSVDLERWSLSFDDMFARIAGRFAQRQSRLRARDYLLGLLSQSERKNGWTLAEFAGHGAPDGMQRLLNHHVWDADEVRDDVRGYVVEHLRGARGVLVVDEIGFIKKGSKSAGVQRQYSGTAGRVENCQIGVFLGYASPRGRALVDRELYVPRHSWCADRDRCRGAGIPDAVGFATKPELGRRMIERAVAVGVPFRWVTGDEVYGGDPKLAGWLEQRGIGYLLAVACDQRVPTAAGRLRADALAARVPERGWQRLSAGDGAHGPRCYDWALVGLDDPRGQRLLIRRSISDSGELAYYLCHAPDGAPAARTRPCRRHPLGDRGMLSGGEERGGPGPLPGPALPRLVPAHHAGDAGPRLARRHRRRRESRRRKGGSTGCGHQPTPNVIITIPGRDELIPLTVNEIRRLRATLTRRVPRREHTLAWSRWRRRHQARARHCHYRSHATAQTGSYEEFRGRTLSPLPDDELTSPGQNRTRR